MKLSDPPNLKSPSQQKFTRIKSYSPETYIKFSKRQHVLQINNLATPSTFKSTSIINIEQQIHKLRTEAIHMSYYDQIKQRSISCLLQRIGKKTRKQNSTNVIDILKFHYKKHARPKNVECRLPKLNISGKRYQKHSFIIYESQEHEESKTKLKDSYPTDSVVNLERNMRHRLSKLPTFTQKDTKVQGVNQSLTGWKRNSIDQQQQLVNAI